MGYFNLGLCSFCEKNATGWFFLFLSFCISTPLMAKSDESVLISSGLLGLYMMSMGLLSSAFLSYLNASFILGL
jgi:hypothetical protein